MKTKRTIIMFWSCQQHYYCHINNISYKIVIMIIIIII